MENKQPILSICIPTYNRANVLKENLIKLVNLPEFDEEVEIVISDNASTDDTENIVRNFVLKYKNIKYYKNESNLKDLNFMLAMNRGTGNYIRLLNDRIRLTNEGLGYIKSKVKEHIIDRTPLFFTDNRIYTKRKAEKIVCSSLDDYVQSISTFVTLIGIFGAWKEQWENVVCKNKYVEYLLCQNDWSYQIVLNNNGCLIYDKKVTESVPVHLGERSGYNWFKVHLDNYYQIMMPYIELGKISQETYKQDKKYLFLHFRRELINIFILIKKDIYFKFDTQNTLKYFWKYYKNECYFYFVIILFPIWFIYYNLPSFIRKYFLTSARKAKNLCKIFYS